MLDSKLAQRIADEVMNGLGYNINVMNKNAIIIGSGSNERIGSFHETAMKAITHCEAFEVTEKEAQKLRGVKAGINLPIFTRDGQILGVIGITGEPEKVRNIGKLVKMTAELIIEQDDAMKRSYKHINDKELFVTTLLNDTPGYTHAEIDAWGARIGYDMRLPRIACILTLCDKQKHPLTDSFLLDTVKHSCGHTKQDISVQLASENILVFKVLDTTDPWAIEASLTHYLEGIKATLKEKRSPFLSIYVGNYYLGIEGYRKSYEDALHLLKSASPEKTTLHFGHRRLIAILYDHLPEDFKTNVLDPYLNRLSGAFGKGFEDVMDTLSCLYLYNQSYDEAAKTLFLHKNTINFRKQKVAEALALDLKHSTDNLDLLRLIIYHYFQRDVA